LRTGTWSKVGRKRPDFLREAFARGHPIEDPPSLGSYGAAGETEHDDEDEKAMERHFCQTKPSWKMT
jgi:hypothetical protein